MKQAAIIIYFAVVAASTGLALGLACRAEETRCRWIGREYVCTTGNCETRCRMIGSEQVCDTTCR